MLKKINRLPSINLKNSKRVQADTLSVKIAENNLSTSRFGFVISKKIDKRATTRNRLKRKLSSSVEEIFDKIENGYDVVFYPRVEALSVPQAKTTEEIKKIFKKEKILND